jgi:acetyltransferase-like isoleucine patch superfamily enzyme
MREINIYCDHTINKKQFNKRLKQIKKMKIYYKIVCFLGLNKIKYLKKNNIFGHLGENVLYQPTTLPNNPKLVKIHNNVKIAADVIFYEHDVINYVFQKIDGQNYIGHMSCIEIFDNVFVGGKSVIVGNVKIGPNAIIAAGSIVNKDVPEGTIVAGNPAQVIGKFEDLHKKRMSIESNRGTIKLDERYKELWNNFYNKKGK